MGAYDYLLGAQGVQLPDPVKTAQQTMSLAQAADARRVTQYQLEKMMREDAAAKGLGDAIPGIKDVNNDEDVMRVLASAPAEARAGIAKYVTEQRKAAAETKYKDAETGQKQWDVKKQQIGLIGGLAQTLASKPDVGPQDVQAAAATLKRAGLDPDEIIPPPGVDPRAHWQALVGRAVEADKQVTLQLTAARDRETGRHNQSNEAIQAATLQETAGHNRRTEGNAADRLALERNNANQGTLSVAGIGADGQTVLVNNKTGALVAAGQGGGQPYNGPVMSKDAGEKRQVALQAADRADKLLGMVQESPRAFSDVASILSHAPAFAGQRLMSRTMTPEDRQVRTTVMREAALELNRLYGAALSQGENARAKSFIPDPDDDLPTVMSKLTSARDWARETAGGSAGGARPTGGGDWKDTGVTGVRIRQVSQ